MQIAYVSSLISKEMYNIITKNSEIKPLQSIQNFHRYVCEGLANSNCKVCTISSIPVNRKITKKMIFKKKSEKLNKVEYNYIPFINIKIIKQISIFFGIIYMVIKNKNKIFICDILNNTISYTTLLLSKIFKFKCYAIVTDLPVDMNGKIFKFTRHFQKNFDGYIFLTENMNEVINKKNRPYLIIEAITDFNLDKTKIQSDKKNICMYAGGLYEKYGIKTLIESFENLSDCELHLYGFGALDTYIQKLNMQNVKYCGNVSHDEILKKEKSAKLLINPRFSSNDYTKYSFPSKIIEYMASGTPVLTTKLKGIPSEYDNYLYYFELENKESFANKIREIIKKDNRELYNFGKNAQNFVLKNKNKNVQGSKIYEFIKNDK